jgi:hypothetical protein
MERRKALAVAAAGTIAIGAMVVTGVELTGASFLGFGAGHHTPAALMAPSRRPSPRVVTHYRDEYTAQVVEPVVSTAIAPATIVAPPPATTVPRAEPVGPSPSAHRSTDDPSDDNGEPEAPPPSPIATTSTTSTTSSTTTTTVPYHHDVTDDCALPPCPDT